MKKSVRQWLQTFTLQKEILRDYRAEITAENNRVLFSVSVIGAALCAVLVALSLPFVGILRLFSAYAALLAVFAGVALLAKTVCPAHPKLVLPFYYALAALIDGIAIIMGTAMGPDTNATTFLLVQLLLPLFILDSPWRLLLFNTAMTALFFAAELRFKAPGPIRGLDFSNAAVVWCISALFVQVAVRRNAHALAAQRHEQLELEQKNRLINQLPVGVAAFEVRGGVTKQIFTNDEFYRLFQDTRADRAARMQGNFMNGIHPDDRARLGKAMQAVIAGESDTMTMACRSQKGDGSYLWVRFSSAVAKRQGDYLLVYSTYSSMEEEMKSRQATQAKSDFLSRMSHDIRTPMNAIIGLTGLAKEETDPAAVREYLEHITTSSEFLLGLINDILDMSKIESGEFSLNPEPFSGREFIATMDAVIRPMMEKKGIRYSCRATLQQEVLLIDKLRFNQIFLNLLSNACKFTPAGGTVEWFDERLPQKDGRVGLRITVRDSGVGMSADFQEKIFTPFLQERTALVDNTPGTGLGLPIVKSLVEAMNGTITLQSQPGSGTTYTLEFYFARAEAAPQQAAAQPAVDLRGAEILLAEDNEMNVLVATHLLQNRGCHVTVARNGREAAQLFAAAEPGHFAAVLMDVRMPEMDGLAATRAIRALQKADAQTVPIIAMTADAFAEEQKRTLAAGMNYHLTKPIDPALLYQTLGRYLQPAANE